jgi:transposase-like protein
MTAPVHSCSSPGHPDDCRRHGRPPALGPWQVRYARRALAAKVDITVIAKVLGCGRSTVYRAVRHAGPYRA